MSVVLSFPGMSRPQVFSSPVDAFIQRIADVQDCQVDNEMLEFLRLLNEALNQNNSKEIESLLTHPKFKDRVLLCQNQLLIRPFLRRDLDGRIFLRVSDSKFETISLTLKQSDMIPASIPRIEQEPLDPSHSQIAPDFKEDNTEFYAVIPQLIKAIDEKNKDVIAALCALPECRDRMFLLHDTLHLRLSLYRDSDGTLYLNRSNCYFLNKSLDSIEAAFFTSIPRVDSFFSGPGWTSAIPAGEFNLVKILKERPSIR